MSTKQTIPAKLQAWIDARKKYHLSHAHVQMARELGLNPHKLGKIANNKQEPWKSPLPDFIEDLYLKRFGKSRPAVVKSIEQLEAERQGKKPKPVERAQAEQ
jgi:hypothetical protein